MLNQAARPWKAPAGVVPSMNAIGSLVRSQRGHPASNAGQDQARSVTEAERSRGASARSTGGAARSVVIGRGGESASLRLHAVAVRAISEATVRRPGIDG